MTDLEFTVRLKDEVSAQAAKVSKEIEGISSRLPAMQANAQTTTQAMINFNRIVSDAPYGLIGIANNIDPMVMSFQKLKQETGTTGSAIKSMLGALTSPSGISLAISLASSLAIAFGPRLVSIFKSAGKEAEDFNLKMETLNTNLKIWQKYAADYINEFQNFSDADLMSKAAKVEVDLQKYRKALMEVTAAEKSATGATKKQLEEMKANFTAYVSSLETAADKIVSIINSRKEAESSYSAQLDTFYQKQRLSHAAIVHEALNNTKSIVGIMSGATIEFQEAATHASRVISTEVQNAADGLSAQLRQSVEMTYLFFNGIQAGFSTLSAEIGNGLYNEIDKALGGANSLLEKFLASVSAKIAEQVAMKGLKAILSLIPGVGAFAEFLPFHSGGTVPRAHSGMYINAPSNREFPIIVRGGETVRTEAQESALRGRSAGGSITINFNVPVSEPQYAVSLIKKAIRETGLSADKLLVNNKYQTVIA